MTPLQKTPSTLPLNDTYHSSSSKQKSSAKITHLKHCAVCGDIAVGYNFGAIACESCKAFFRRNALRSVMPQCIFNGKCSIQTKTRRFCSPCRLEKCISVGMLKSCIMDEQSKRERREKILRNRALKIVFHEHDSSVQNTQENDADYESLKNMEFSPFDLLVSSSCSVSFPTTRNEMPTTTSNRLCSLSSTKSHRSHDFSWETVLTKPEVFRTADSNNAPRDHLASMAILSKHVPMMSSFPMSFDDSDRVNWSQYVDRDDQQRSMPKDIKPIVNPKPSSLPKKIPTSENTLYENQIINLTRHSSIDSSSLPVSHLATGSAMTTVTNVLDGHVWTSEPEEPSNKNCISLCTSLFTIGMARLLSKDQWTALNDLRKAYETSFRDSDADHTPDNSASLTLSSLVNTSGFLVRKFINFAKKLADFSVLGQENQIHLLKGVVLNALFIRSASHYDVVRDVWITPAGDIPTKILTVATGLQHFYEEHAKYCRNFCEVVKKDTHLVALMQVLCLFAPDRPGLTDRQSVSNIYDRYILLLKHYLEARHGFTHGRTILASVLTNLAELQALTDNHGHILLHVDPSKVDPLILEVFNLSHRSVAPLIDPNNKRGFSFGHSEKCVSASNNKSEPSNPNFSSQPVKPSSMHPVLDSSGSLSNSGLTAEAR